MRFHEGIPPKLTMPLQNTERSNIYHHELGLPILELHVREIMNIYYVFVWLFHLA